MSDIKERPIIFNAQEVNAVLAGDKTQHRVPEKLRYGMPEFIGGRYCDKSDPKNWGWDNFEDGETRLLSNEPCPLGAIGDRLWVQEPSLIHCDWDWFYADSTLVKCKEPFSGNDLDLPWDDEHQEYIGPIGAEYLPRWASRILLEITDIRIERIKDISKSDAIAMGIKPIGVDPKTHRPTRYPDYPIDKGGFNSILQSFAKYWGSTHGIGAWDRNDWVWVVEFKAIKGVQVDGTD